jgi:hypothetical protein
MKKPRSKGRSRASDADADSAFAAGVERKISAKAHALEDLFHRALDLAVQFSGLASELFDLKEAEARAPIRNRIAAPSSRIEPRLVKRYRRKKRTTPKV